MAIGGAGALVPVIIQYGIPAAMELAELVADWLRTLHANPNMTQAEYDVLWAAMQVKYKAATDKHEALRQQGR